MPLFARSYQELVSSSLEDLANNTNLTRLSAGGKARALLESVNRRLEETYDTFDLNMSRAFVSSAPGQYLDLIGGLLGVDRESARTAGVDADLNIIRFYVDSGTFGDINNSTDIVIPQGTIISTDDNESGVTYRLKSSAVLGASASLSYIAAEATIPGSDSNIGTGALRYHNFTDYTDNANETLLVNNIHPIANGEDFESDANYRYRIVNRVLEAEAANLTAIRLAGLSVAGVADIIIKRRYRGIGTVGVIIQSTTPSVSDSLVEAVRARVERVMAYGDIAYVMGPKETGVSFRFTVHYARKLSEDEMNLIEEDLDDVIMEYVNSLDIGDTFSVNRLVSELFAVSEDITNFGITGKPIDQVFIYKESRLGDNRVREELLGDYTPDPDDERVIIEQSVSNPITYERKYNIRR